MLATRLPTCVETFLERVSTKYRGVVRAQKHFPAVP